MNLPANLYVAGVGLISCLGDTIATNAAALAAGISQFAQSPIYSHTYTPLKLATIPDQALPELNADVALMPGLTQRQSRMLRSMGPALAGCLGERQFPVPLPLFLALPESNPAKSTLFSDMFTKIMLQTGVPLDVGSSRQIALGRAAGVYAFRTAAQYLAQTGNDFALVAGMDSPFDHAWLAHLDYEERASRQGAMHSFVPGEATACVLVSTRRGIETLGLTNKVALAEPCVADEPNDQRNGQQPGLGNALTEAVRSAINSDATTAPVAHVFSTLNGEPANSKEISIALTRNTQALAANWTMHHPADCIGDIGAAFTPALVGLAAYHLASQQLSGSALVVACSDGKSRGAMVVRRES